MDPEYLQQLVDMLASQGMDPQYLLGLIDQIAPQGDQGMLGDPYAPSGGFPSPPMPNGKMPQYRTQGSGFVSDGTVRDMLSKVLVNQDQFSPDALFATSPDLKGIFARAVSEAGHDPYAATDLLSNTDPYRKMLLDVVNERVGGAAPQVEPEEDVNLDGVKDVQDVSFDQYLAALQAQNQGLMTSQPLGRIGIFGDELTQSNPYQKALEDQLSAVQAEVDNLITQAAPSIQRNQNNLDASWMNSGGMPYQGMGSGGIDYTGTGGGFVGGGGGGPAPMGGPDPLQTEFVRRYLESKGVDFAKNERMFGRPDRPSAPRSNRSAGRSAPSAPKREGRVTSRTGSPRPSTTSSRRKASAGRRSNLANRRSR